MAAPNYGTMYISPNQAHQAYGAAVADAEALYKSMKGLGTDDKVLSNVIATRTRDQLQEIKAAFQTKYGKTLKSFIEGDASGNYRDLLVSLIENKGELDAHLVHHAIEGLGTNDDELIETLCTRNNADIINLKHAYVALYKKDVEKDVVGDTSGDYKNLLLAILKAERVETAPVDVAQAKADAKALYAAGEGKIGTNEKVFIDILTKRSFPQLFAINECYAQEHGHSLESAITKETSFNFKQALVTLLTPRDEFFAKQIHEAIAGLGTNDQKLIRLLSHVSSDKSLCQATNNWYMHKYNHNIANDVGGDTSGWYKKTAQALMSNRTAL